MHTLLVRLTGPMQSWGTQSRFTERDTGLEPSKSGVIGLLCAALGRRRDEPVGALAALWMGVRVDREGVLLRDYQTALNVAKADGSKPGTVVSNRYYLADAAFLVALVGNDLALLREIDEAVGQPRWPLFLGRKAFVPSRPVRLDGGGVREERSGEAALRAEPWRPRAGGAPWLTEPERLRVVLEVAPSLGAERRIDQPDEGAAFAHRRFLPRHVETRFWTIGDDVQRGEADDD